jgi:hypothetical protein
VAGDRLTSGGLAAIIKSFCLGSALRLTREHREWSPSCFAARALVKGLLDYTPISAELIAYLEPAGTLFCAITRSTTPAPRPRQLKPYRLPAPKVAREIRRSMHNCLQQAYERELDRELRRLEAAFGEWPLGRISSRELTAAIRTFRLESLLPLRKEYRSSKGELRLAAAISRGLLDQRQVPQPLLFYLGAKVLTGR